MQRVLVVGTGGLAREFTAWFGETVEVVGYSTQDEGEHARFHLPGLVFGDVVTPSDAGTNLAVLAIGTPALRRRLMQQFEERGFSFPTFVHGSAVVASSAQFGRGAVICPQSVVSANVVIGESGYINYCCGIGHDTVIGAFCQINPGAQIGGGCTIGEETLVGSGSVVRHNVKVGNGATIASGSAVFGKVAPGCTMMGNPASRFRMLHA